MTVLSLTIMPISSRSDVCLSNQFAQLLPGPDAFTSRVTTHSQLIDREPCIAVFPMINMDQISFSRSEYLQRINLLDIHTHFFF